MNMIKYILRGLTNCVKLNLDQNEPYFNPDFLGSSTFSVGRERYN